MVQRNRSLQTMEVIGSYTLMDTQTQAVVVVVAVDLIHNLAVEQVTMHLVEVVQV